MITRPLLTLAMAAFLPNHPTPARPAVLGVVMVANRVHINTVAVTAGATVYDGDRFSIETPGALELQDHQATLQVAGGSEVTVRSWPNGAPGTQAELAIHELVEPESPDRP